MKKLFSLITISLILLASVFGQSNNTVDISDDVYELLRFAELKGLCTKLSNVKPYTQNYIINKLNETIEFLEDNDGKESEIKIFENAIRKFEIKKGLDPLRASLRIENSDENFPITFIINNTFKTDFSSGLYTDNSFNSNGYEIFDHISFYGDFGKNISYRNTTFLGVTEMPLQYLGVYDIGKWAYINQENQTERVIKKLRNNSYLPYDYVKSWDGSCYLFSNVSATGLKGWASSPALAFGMFGEIHGSFFNDRLNIGVNRNFREWGAMDDGSSLILNSKARPFLGLDTEITFFNWLKVSSVTGILEFPNRDDVLVDAYFKIDSEGKRIGDEMDSFFYQNCFALTMIDLDFKYVHLDFGSGCIFPKRFDVGYAFPLIDRVVYQNNTGDYDNLSLFGDIKLQYPGLGAIWFSGYLDEINAFTTKFWEKTRAMFGLQAGFKFVIPELPLSTFSFRYTKIEPFCYTHHVINNTPYFNHYVDESYTNNGENLGYYLPPNSDEFHLRFETRAIENSTLSLTYQLIRHGVDWGSKATIGNNIYSELQVDRENLYKYFLRDGTYEWSNIISLQGSYDFRKYKLPVKLNCKIGYIYDWFTEINGEPGKKQTYSFVSNDEYKDRNGVVLTLGVSIFN